MAKISEKEILKIIQDALKLNEGIITLDTGIGDVEEWDSLGHLGILAALDKFFNGKIAGIRDMATAKSVRQILQILKENSLM